jgi:DNA-binding NtrC family response regulator
VTSRVLVVDDEEDIRAALRRILRKMGLEVVEAADGIEAERKLAASGFDLVLTDWRMPGADGFAVLAAVRERSPGTPAIMLTAQGGIAQAVAAIKAGASDFLGKPFHPSEIEDVVNRALAAKSGEKEQKRGRRPQASILGESAALRQVLDTVGRVAPTDATVLVTGETGTGKEVVARLLHNASGRAGFPFVAVDCGSIPENLIESELFGHSRGAFTGANEKRVGKFAQADGGTVFLDEVGELPLAMQAKLLRVLQEREVTPLGESTPIRIDVRVVAATNRDLAAMAQEGTFRSDLYYRLEVVPIEMPALRKRPDDVPILAQHFLDSTSRRLGRPLKLTPEAMAVLQAHRWPGNVRELENLIERLAVLARGEVIGIEDLPATVRNAAAAASAAAEAERAVSGAAAAAAAAVSAAAPAATGRGALPTQGIDLARTLEDVEDQMIREALRRSGGNKAQAAKLLGINRTTLVEKLKRRKIEIASDDGEE